MLIDMHCHTAEGSLDAHASIFEIVDKLKIMGFDGVVVTDHNSYKGYEAWVRSKRNDFLVLKGIEYDSYDAGHIIVILPSDVDDKIFRYRGMRIKDLSQKVHELGGVLGPAHPFDHGRLGMCRWPKYKNIFNLDNTMKLFDFVESFNSSASSLGNAMAKQLALRYKLPGTGGSDSHRERTIGFGKTFFTKNILSNEDLIKAIKDNAITNAEGEYTQKNL